MYREIDSNHPCHQEFVYQMGRIVGAADEIESILKFFAEELPNEVQAQLNARSQGFP